ncbi:hypothetical protein [Luteimonas salinilitoris]|uniref:Uncharacterized protein n=1 Tax=Luteimonas salinilitoris TaxID=3237697 RepID=A0ABV4HSP5_9GAMM
MILHLLFTGLLWFADAIGIGPLNLHASHPGRDTADARWENASLPISATLPGDCQRFDLSGSRL